MNNRVTIKIVDGLDRTVTTSSVASYKDPAQQERVCRSYLTQVRSRWTHCSEEDRAAWGYYAWNDKGEMICYG